VGHHRGPGHRAGLWLRAIRHIRRLWRGANGHLHTRRR
jgi:hypothetical protein